MILIWAGLAPAIAFGGCALAIGAPLHIAGVLTIAGLLAGLTGGGIVLDHIYRD